MKRFVLSISLLLISIVFSVAQTPLSRNGKIKVVGNQLTNECGSAIQLRGMSTHGPQWFENCYSSSSMDALANDWGADIIRLAMYTEASKNGYLANPGKWDAWIDDMVNMAEDRGMYCIIDWHILEDNDPHTYKSQAKTFFNTMSSRYKNKSHVLYEICNEPNGNVNWSRIKSYAEEVIPVIRNNDPDGIIIVGTPEWSGKPWDVVSNKLTGSNAHNVMYTFHFYSSHYTHDNLRGVLGSIPVFVTEWGTSHHSGNGGFNSSNSNTWLNILNGNNDGNQLVSWCNWSFADKNETSAGLQSGACGSGQWTNTSQSGTYVRSKMNTPDNFPNCSSTTDSDGDGVFDINDDCSDTPSGEAVNSRGCSDSDGDGVFNDKDICPNTPSGATVDADGCQLNVNTTNYTAAIDSFNSVSPVSINGGEYGIFWWVGETATDQYELTRKTTGMELDLTSASPDYQVFGLSFGEDKNINVKDLNNADINLNLTNNTNGDIFLAIQLMDSLGNKAEIVPEDPIGISWTNQWEKIGISIPQGETVDVTIDLSSDPNAIGGLAAGAYNCGPPTGAAVTCPETSYDLDPNKLAQLIFIVNGGAGTTDSPDLSPVSGKLIFNHFSIGDVTSSASNIINAIAINDEDGDGVPDATDACPGTPEGTIVDATGCEVTTGTDTDGDGVDDAQDLCPGTPTGATVNAQGCAESQLDDDNDGVFNDKDLCANTPASVTVDADGCPESVEGSNFIEIGIVRKDPAGFPFADKDYAYDDFSNDEEKFDNGPGIFWWDGEKPTFFSSAKERRICNVATNEPGGVAYTVTQDATKYEPFGVGFGQNVAETKFYTINLSNNANLETVITNESNRELTIRAALQDVNDNILDFDMAETQVQITLAAGATGTLSANYTDGYWYDYNSPGCSPCINEAADFFDYNHIKGVNFTVISGNDHWKDEPANNIVDAVVSITSFKVGNTAGVTSNGCAVIGLRDDIKNDVRIFPIPASNVVTVSQENFDFSNANILDLTGNILESIELTSTQQKVSLENLAKGTYILQLLGTEKAQQVRIVVQ